MFFVAKIFAIKKFSVIFLIAFGAILNHASFAAGEVDTSFNPWAQFRANGDVHCSLTQPDGKILVGGSFTAVNGYAAHLIARLNVDGSVDTSFNPPQFFNASFEVRIFTIAVQSNGKILVGGMIESADGQFSLGVRRLNPNGSLDTTFQSSNLLSSSEINVIKVQPDDKFLMGGIFSHASGRNNLVKYNADGSLDESFTFPVSVTRIHDVEFLPDGKMLVGGGLGTNGILLRINPNGATDSSFVVATINGTVRKIKTHPNGKIMIGGVFATVNGIQRGGLARFNSDGTHDPTFNQGGAGAIGQIRELKIKSDGKILLGGTFSSFNGNARWRIAQLNEDGTHDFLFYPGLTFIGDANALEVLPDGKILVGLSYNGTENPGGLARLNADGAVDNSISYYVNKNGFIRKIVTQPDGKILVCGEFDAANNASRPGVARFNPDGTLDTTFNPTFSPQKIHALALQADGKILIGMHGGLGLKRLNADGSIDSSFVTGNVGGNVYDIVVLPNTQILIGGFFIYNDIADRFVVRVSQNGSMDLSFANPPFLGAPVLKIFVQPTGKIVVGGGALRVNNGIIRLNTNGTIDPTFTASTPSTIIDIDSQADGKLVVVGNFSTLNGSSAGRNIGRLTADGALDSFTQTTDGQLEGVKVQADGKILVSGSMTNLGGGAVNRKGLARFNADVSIDTSFIANTNGIARDVLQQTDGKILAGGQFTRINGISKVSIARLSNAPRNSFDFDGDGKADVAVFRPSENKWYVLRSSDLGVTQQVFAVAGDVPVPADYDGDGKTDFAIFRPSTGDWWYLSSLNAAQVSAHWGAAGDIPRPSDFDGDGRADYVLFRPSDNFWYRASSANGATSNAAFGLAGDKPVIGDFDGDGKSDKAIFRPSTGDWWWQSSLDNAQRATHWGADTDIPAPADFDGDGKTDFAVYRPSTGAWYVVNSGNGSFTILSFGIAEDKPVPADYDGDGKADIAVFRPSNGAWYLLRSTDGFFALSFGISTDVPTPNAFVP